MTHRVLKRPFEVVPEEVEPEQPLAKRPRELTDDDIDPLNYLDYLQQQLYDSMELRQLSGLFVERLFGGVSRVCLYKKPRSNRRTKYNRADFASLGLVVLHQKFTQKLRDQIYDQGYRKVKLNQEFNGKVVLQPATLLDMGYYSVSVLLHPPLIAPDPASQPEFDMVIDDDVIDAAFSRNGHELSAYHASILGDSETPTVLKGTAINAHAATMSLLLAYHEAKRLAGPAPRFCKPRSFGAWMETVFVDVLPADVIENIRRYLCVLPLDQVSRSYRTWTLDCALATGVYFSRSDSMTYERAIESPLPLDPSSWWWHRVLAEPKPLPFAHVSRLGGAAPPRFRLALRLFRHPAHFGLDRNDAVPLRSLSSVYCCMELGARLLQKFEPGRTSSRKFRAEYDQQLCYITWVLASYYSVTAVMWSFYSATGMARNADLKCTFDKMQSALYSETRLTVFMPREEVLHTILNVIDHGLWPQAYNVKPNCLADEGMPPLWPYFSENMVSAAAVVLNQSARTALFKAMRKLRVVSDTGKFYVPYVEYGTSRIILDGDLTFKKFLVHLTVAPSWKPTPCGLCRNCVSHIEGLSTSVCLAPTYLPTGPLRKHPESLGSAPGWRNFQFGKRCDHALDSTAQKVMALIHPGTTFIKDSHDFWTACSTSNSYEKRRPAAVFQDVYRLRSFSGHNSAPHNHFIDGGEYRASLLEDEGHWLQRAESLGFHLPISNFCKERDFAIACFFLAYHQEMTRESSNELGLSTSSARRSFALRTIGVSHPADPRDLLIDRTLDFSHVLHELRAATEPIRDSLSGKSIYAHAHSTALDGMCVPGEYPFDCMSDARRSAYAKEINERHISQTKFVTACRPYPGAKPFGSLASDFGLPVRRAKSPCEHVYQLRIRVHGSTKRGADFYDSNINFAISTQSHTTIKRVVMTRDAAHRSVVPRLRKSSVNPPRKFDRLESHGASLEEAVSGGSRLSSFGKLHVRDRKWITETDLSPEATRAIFEPDQLRHQWEALSWMTDLRGYSLYTGIDPDTGYHQPIDSFHARRGTLNGNALTMYNIMDMDTQDDSAVHCRELCQCEECDF
jgi:hypothetical protein